MKTAIIDYGSGNVFSVSAALKRLGVEPVITCDEEIIKSADSVIFPGVGHAKFAMQQIKEKQLDLLIPRLKQPVLGICLGMQLMCEWTEEGNVTGLGIFERTKVLRFTDAPKVPHMGWNKLGYGKSVVQDCESEVYFVHSYFVEVNEYTTSVVEYGSRFSASMQKDNFFACQFHPEKSGKQGEQILANFLKQ